MVGGEASDGAQDRGIRPEEGRADKRAGGSEEPDGLAGKGKEAENDDAHRARLEVEADPRGPNQVLPGHLRESLVSVIAVRRAQSPLPLREHKLTKVPFRDP